MHGYARKQGCSEDVGEHFRPYAPEVFQAAKEHLFGGKTAGAKMRLLRGRAKCKERRAARCKMEVASLIGSFIRGVEADRELVEGHDECLLCPKDYRNSTYRRSLRLIHQGETTRTETNVGLNNNCCGYQQE